jgi:hypothetical protein
MARYFGQRIVIHPESKILFAFIYILPKKNKNYRENNDLIHKFKAFRITRLRCSATSGSRTKRFAH